MKKKLLNIAKNISNHTRKLKSGTNPGAYDLLKVFGEFD